jgi:SAM-dependent methyltransferase
VNDPRNVNAGEIQRWNGALGKIWAARQDDFDKVIGPLGAAAMDAAAIKPGERIIDIGCGCGTTSTELARLAGSNGEVLGVDISDEMLSLAEARAKGNAALKFVKADAQLYEFAKTHFDVAFSRVGVMFFDDPEQAFRNIRTALRAGGRLAFVCFRKPSESSYLMVPLTAAYKHVPQLPVLPPGAPGMFSFADDQRVRGILQAAGFQSIEVKPLDLDIDVTAGRGLDGAVSISMELGPTGNAMMGKPPELWQAAAKSIHEAFASHLRGSSVTLTAGVWIVTATNPG